MTLDLKKLPNALTIARLPVLLLLPLTHFLGEARFLWAFALIVLGCATDFLDGILARKLNAITDLGKWLDPLMDKVFVIGVLMWLHACGVFYPGALVLSLVFLFRELAVTQLRSMNVGSDAVEIGAQWHGKLKTILIMGSLIVISGSLAFTSLPNWVLWIGWVCHFFGSIFALISGFIYLKVYSKKTP